MLIQAFFNPKIKLTMRRFLLPLFLTLVFSGTYSAQVNFYYQVKKYLEVNHPELSTANRIIAVNFWNVSSPESRKCNQALDKAFKVYEYARLKGGLQGMIAIAINLDKLGSTADITFKKDGVTKVITASISDFEQNAPVDSNNLIYDSGGHIIYEDLPSDKIFDTINKLITR
jgi:hypothetical protein